MALRNFIQDAQLKEYVPKIANQLWSTQTDYQPQIDKAFSILMTDLWNRGIDPKQVMIPETLKSQSMETQDTIGSGVEIHNGRRFVVDIDSYSGSIEVDLQGSHDNANWNTILTAVVTGSAIGEYSTVISNKHKYYRYQSRITGSMDYAVSMIDVTFDDIIVHGTFKIVYRDFIKEPNDVWDIRRQLEEKDYENMLNAAKYYYDSSDSDTIEDTEAMRNSLTVNLVR